MSEKLYKNAICFSRMWGVMETLEPLPRLSFDEVQDIVIELAKEFSASGQNDLVKFFVEKSDVIKKELLQS